MKSLKLILFICFFLVQSIPNYAQSYVFNIKYSRDYYDPQDSAYFTTFSNVYRFDLSNGSEILFLKDITDVNYQYYDKDEILTWDNTFLYIKVNNGIRIISIQDTSYSSEIFLGNYISSVKYLKDKSLIFVEYEISNYADSLKEPITKVIQINPQNWQIVNTDLFPSWNWLSNDGTRGYSQERTFAPYDTLYLLIYSTDSFQLLNKLSLEQVPIGITPCKLIYDIEDDLILISYNFPDCRNHRDVHYAVYDYNQQKVLSDISCPYRSSASLTKDAKFIIISEYPYDPIINGEHCSGKIMVYELLSGKLIKELIFPPDGNLYFFDEYPDKFFYYVQTTNEAITVDINDLIRQSISSYSLIATHSLQLSLSSVVLSGDIGVNDAGLPPFLDSDVELSIGANVITPSGYKIKANRINVGLNAIVNGDVYYNQLTNISGTINGTQNSPLELPLFTFLPEFKIATTGLEDIIVPIKGEQILPAGSYNNLEIKKSAKLILTGGIYHFNNFTSGLQSSIIYQAPSELRIANKLDISKDTNVLPSDTTVVNARDLVIYVDGVNGTNATLDETPKAAVIGTSCKVKSNIYVPNGTLYIMQDSEIEGALIAKDLEIGSKVKVLLKSAF